ncbi:NADH dehydrogenase [Candidatus Desantisbacteria bacterium CG1_02_38_46]|uniref:NADH-quinone oxidoreductase subunit NuoF n=2 Tax=unclassified Candidatus Desantisiibacteriota TaxID=3106372 RepID=A0A2H9PCF1_9BACT|nr:MAG: NADH dehydrogenase [Candidatus Desantisbacteria bacterium CG1_02_38_46]PIZ16852.1 MAG: NADH-quinone oxidoreductase subunit NuoF [Candidatus Desantisbacteria bacterium CG_4_10_14_0_8_um_filter_39_17]
MKKITNPENLEILRNSLIKQENPSMTCISVCLGTGCQASGSKDIIESLKQEIEKQKLSEKIKIKSTGCHGFCERGPIVVIRPRGIFYQKVKPEDIAEIINRTILKGEIIDSLLYVEPSTGKKVIYEHEVPFYKKQNRIIFGSNGSIDPTNIEDYIRIEGYSALSRTILKMSPEEIIEEVKRSGLRGRGGGGFPTGVKWESCRNAHGEPKYILCNADEGDPGAFMDRSLLEGNPHSILEGMIIGAYAIGSNEGYIYVRMEYPLAVERLKIAIAQAEEYGLLGKNILGLGFDFTIKINRGAGAFVCGEETALILSIEGKRGDPRQRPPYPAQKGLFGKPTNINNVETWANVPLIINRGAEWYSKIGTAESKGTKIFSLVGKINNTGLIEVPMGMTLREIIYDIGGGIPGGKKFKAVQTGGPSGGCIPEEFIDLPVDYDELTKVGSMMGSGGMIVMDENTCMVDIAKYFLTFLADESCGKCVPCREGVFRMLEIVTDITEGKGKEEDIPLLEELSKTIVDTSLCALGGTAPNPVISTIKYFRSEYEAHIKEKRCPAGVCKALICYEILADKCTGCGACLKVCPQEAISGEKKKVHTITQEKCIKCGICMDTCRFEAIEVK